MNDTLGERNKEKDQQRFEKFNKKSSSPLQGIWGQKIWRITLSASRRIA
jgi:hypothetical protein